MEHAQVSGRRERGREGGRELSLSLKTRRPLGKGKAVALVRNDPRVCYPCWAAKYATPKTRGTCSTHVCAHFYYHCVFARVHAAGLGAESNGSATDGAECSNQFDESSARLRHAGSAVSGRTRSERSSPQGQEFFCCSGGGCVCFFACFCVSCDGPKYFLHYVHVERKR